MSPYFMTGLRKKLDWWTQILHGLVAQVEPVEAMMALETVKKSLLFINFSHLIRKLNKVIKTITLFTEMTQSSKSLSLKI